MRIAIDIGHNNSVDIGARGIGNEDNMVMDTGRSLQYLLNKGGHETLVVTPVSASNLSESLSLRVQRANQWGAELYVSIHANAGGGSGTEVWIGSEAGRKVAESILYNITALGFKNRGVKVQGIDGKSLYVLRTTIMTAVLVECCFVDSKEDMELFNSEKMAEAIYKGITGTRSIDKTEDSTILKLQKNLNFIKIRDFDGNPLVEDGIIGPKTRAAVMNFQKIMEIAVDGIPGVNTNYALNEILKRPLCQINCRYFYAVRYIQFKVGSEIDGLFGKETFDAVLNFQKKNGILEDGIVGNETWDKIFIN